LKPQWRLAVFWPGHCGDLHTDLLPSSALFIGCVYAHSQFIALAARVRACETNAAMRLRRPTAGHPSRQLAFNLFMLISVIPRAALLLLLS
jgi:hypothetical protein